MAVLLVISAGSRSERTAIEGTLMRTRRIAVETSTTGG